MRIFEWEASVIAKARTWPMEGSVFEFFKFWSDYNESKWVILVLIILLIFKFGFKKIVPLFVSTSVTVLIADFISRRLIKSFFMRPRPNFVDMTCEMSKCWGFVSSHSTNVAAAATFLCLYNPKNIYWTVPCVVLVGLSRIYLIDHFPLDVLGGFALGAVVGGLIWMCFRFLCVRYIQKSSL